MHDTTSGSDSRAARSLDAPELAFDLAAEVEALRAEPGYTDFGRSSKTLARSGPLRLVLTAVRAETDLGAQKADGPLAIHVLEGEVTSGRDGSTGDRLAAGTVAWFSSGGAWSVRAERDAALLLSVAGDDGSGDEGAAGAAEATR